MKAEDEVRKVQENGKFERVGKKEIFFAILSYCVERVRKFKYISIHVAKKYIARLSNFPRMDILKMHISEKGEEEKKRNTNRVQLSHIRCMNFLQKFGCLVCSCKRCSSLFSFFLFVYIANLTV